MAKDLFSAQAKTYSRYRPGYPQELFDFIAALAPQHDLAWDCATGNGQAAAGLSPYFNKVIATDISESQLSFAIQKENIEYRISPAETSGLDNNSADLITVAQAYHWINWDLFHKEANRVGKKNAVVAIWMYNRMIIGDPVLEEIYNRFYFEITGPYWDPERKYVDDNYESVKFDFADAGKKQFQSIVHWNLEDFTGYLSSWSAVQKFLKQNKHSALDLIKDELIANWKNAGTKPFIFPIWLRYGRIG
jgi:ubiquinone/menaquinone biosynthesis C-methylase UbiE